MKAAAFNEFGPPEVITLQELPVPEIGKGMVLVKVRNASVNPADYKVRNGSLSFISGKNFPKIAGGDFAGTVTQVGEEVDKSMIGKRVYGTTGAMRKGGACAEYVAISVREVAEFAEDMTWEQAAAIPVAGLTALQGLRDYLKAEPGRRVLINGCTGGVGHLAVQIARVMECKVVGTCSEKNMEFARELGVHQVYDYHKNSLQQSTEPFYAVFDVSVSLGFSEAQNLLSARGTYLNTLPNAASMAWWPIRNGFATQKAHSMLLSKSRKDLKLLASWVSQKKVVPHISGSYSLENTAQAHAALEKGGIRGKLIIEVAKG